MTKVCPNCQNEVKEEHYFCFVCGTRIYDLGLNPKWQGKLLVGEDIPWGMIEKELCKVEEFVPLYSRLQKKIAPNEDVPTKFPIYALLAVNSMTLRNGAIMPVLHQEDFCNLWTAFRDRDLSNGVVYVSYTQFYKNRPLEFFKATGPWWTKYIEMPKGLPRLHVYIYPSNENRALETTNTKPIEVWHPKGWKS